MRSAQDLPQAFVFAAGLAVGSAILIVTRRLRASVGSANARALAALRAGNQPPGRNSGVYYNAADAPEWLQPLFQDSSLRRVLLREWEDAEWRARAGWKGTDLIHNPTGRGVQVEAYFWDAASLTLTGIVKFGAAAESHRGLCHGGAMTSLMDDLCGHICFFASERPWCGATVQVNCKLQKPVRVGEVHKVVGKIERREKKEGKPTTKVFISAELVAEDGSILASLDGLSVTPVAMSSINDEVDRRSWIVDDEAMRDSAWLL